MLPGEKCSQRFLRDISKSYKQHNLTNIFTVLDLSQSLREREKFVVWAEDNNKILV